MESTKEEKKENIKENIINEKEGGGLMLKNKSIDYIFGMITGAS